MGHPRRASPLGLLHALVRQLGSPWALDGYGGRSFTDVVHQDHLLVAVGPELVE